MAAAAVGTLTINGNLALESDATTILKVAGTSHTAGRVAGTDYDHLAVSGTTQLGGTLVVQAGAGVFAAGDTFDFITSTGGITGTFTAVNVLHNALTFTTSIQNAGADYVLSVTAAQSSFVPFALNGNQAEVARALDSAAGDARAATLISALNGLPGTGLPAAFTRGVWRRLWQHLQAESFAQARRLFIDSTTVRAINMPLGHPKKRRRPGFGPLSRGTEHQDPRRDSRRELQRGAASDGGAGP